MAITLCRRLSMKKITTISLPKTILVGLDQASKKASGYRVSLFVFRIAFDVLQNSIQKLMADEKNWWVKIDWERFITSPNIVLTRNFDNSEYTQDFFKSYMYAEYYPYQYHENQYHESWEDEESYDTYVRIIIKKDFTIAQWDDVVPEDEVLMIMYYVNFTRQEFDDGIPLLQIYLPDPKYRIGDLARDTWLSLPAYNALKRMGII